MANTPRYITKAQVRTIVGLTTNEISDDDLDDVIYDVEFQIERFMNTTYTPKKEIEILDGNGKHIIYAQNVPLLALRSIKDDGTSISVSKVNYARSGRIRLTDSSEVANFKEKENKVILETVFGDVIFPESGGTETLLDGATTIGTSVAMTVDSEIGFNTNDWVEIYGTDGNREIAQVSSTASNTITVDNLLYTHSDNSFVRKLQIPNLIERLMKISSALATVARQVGQSFTDIVGYSMGSFSTQKGEPYTQWRETALQLTQEKEQILRRVQPKATII